MQAPSPKELSEAANISPSYASMILSQSDDPAKTRVPPRPLAIHIYRRTGWKHGSIADLTDEQMELLEQIDPWQPKERAA